MKYKSKVLITISVCVLIIGSIIKSYNIKSYNVIEGLFGGFNPFAGITQGTFDNLVNDAVNKIKNDKNIMKPINEFKNITSQAKNEIKSTVDSMINVVTKDINEIKSSIDKLPDQVLKTTNSLLDDMKKQIDSVFDIIIGDIKKNIDGIFNIFKSMGPIFIEIFGTFKEMVKIMTTTFGFLIEIINKLKICNFSFIKSKPIRARFRETLSKMFDLIILQIQFIRPSVILNPIKVANYLFNIQKKQLEISVSMITNLSLDWADFTKLDISGCIGLSKFIEMGEGYINIVNGISEQLKKLANTVLGIIDKLKDLGIEVSTTAIPINLDFLGFLTNPWNSQELDLSNEENIEFVKLIMEYISKVTNVTVDNVVKIAEEGIKSPKQYDTEKSNISIDT
tara:strand:+ start:1803 stop:2984 length:1182 start_codon:yes stop_codon:yes gene_type:complete